MDFPTVPSRKKPSNNLNHLIAQTLITKQVERKLLCREAILCIKNTRSANLDLAFQAFRGNPGMQKTGRELIRAINAVLPFHLCTIIIEIRSLLTLTYNKYMYINYFSGIYIWSFNTLRCIASYYFMLLLSVIYLIVFLFRSFLNYKILKLSINSYLKIIRVYVKYLIK